MKNPFSKNDTQGQAATAVENSTLENIIRVAKSSYNAVAGSVKRGPGRPRKNQIDENIKLALPGVELGESGAVVENSDNAVLPASDDSVFDQELVTECVGAVVKGACGFAEGALTRKAVVCGYSGKEAMELSVGCAPTEKEINSLGKLAAICLKKYGVGSEYMPEIGLACIGAQIGVRYMSAFRGLIPPALPAPGEPENK